MKAPKITIAEAAFEAQNAGISLISPQSSLTSAQEVLLKRLQSATRFKGSSHNGRSKWYAFRLALGKSGPAPLLSYIVAEPCTHLPGGLHIC